MISEEQREDYRRRGLLIVDPATEKWDPDEDYRTDEEAAELLAESWREYEHGATR